MEVSFEPISQGDRLWCNIHHWCRNIAVKYDHKMILWSGGSRNSSQTLPANKLHVYNPVTGKWSTAHLGIGQNTDLPFMNKTIIADVEVQIFGDKMHAVFNSAMHHSLRGLTSILDLTTLCWEQKKKFPTQKPVARGVGTTWAWKNKIYVFGGLGLGLREQHALEQGNRYNVVMDATDASIYPWGWNNQLAAFDTVTQSWEFPRCSGAEPPCPRFHHAVTLSGEYMLLFGGAQFPNKYNDLYALHMPSHTWCKLLPIDLDIPPVRYSSSLTTVGINRAILYGGTSYDHHHMSDCWLLTWSLTSTGEIENVRWTPWKKQKQWPKASHTALYSPETCRLYLFGGADFNDTDVNGCTSILANPASLLESSLCCMVENDFKSEGLPACVREIYDKRLGINSMAAHSA